MISPSMVRSLIALMLHAGLLAKTAQAWEPLRAHPQNPYLLEFRGQPTVLRTYAESYSSVINSALPFIPYLDVLKRDGMNLTRVWCIGFPPDNPFNPASFLQPWPRSTVNGNALDGLGKWDLTAWNEDYFTRLKAFAQAASERGIVVEFTLFSTCYGDTDWLEGPFHPSNNIQGYGPNNYYDTMRPVDANLYAAQKAAVRRVVRELNAYDNVYFEIQNEPFWNEPGVKDDQEVLFHSGILTAIREEESTLPNRHLVAHNFPQQIANLSAGFDVLNEHYPAAVPSTTIAGAAALLSNHYSRGKILALDETDTTTAIQTRLESWMFLLGGGGIYDGLDAHDLVYSPQDPSGDNALGLAMRTAVRNIGTYIDNLHLVALRRDRSWITSGVPTGASWQAIATRGQQYAAYFHHGQSSLVPFQLHYDPIDSSTHSAAPVVLLEAGSWRAVWTRPEDLVTLQTQEFTHAGGPFTLAPVTYNADVALRIDRTGSGDATPPPTPTGLTAVSNPDGSITLTWNPVQAADLAAYRVYRSESPGVPIDLAHRLVEAPAMDATFTDLTTSLGVLYHYVVTAVDLSGNESTGSWETSATSNIPTPQLVIAVTSVGQYFLEWPAAFPDWRLQESPDLSLGSWTNSTLTPILEGDQFRVIFTPAGERKFFRLIWP